MLLFTGIGKRQVRLGVTEKTKRRSILGEKGQCGV